MIPDVLPQPHIDLFAVFNLLGIIQGIFLCVFFLSKKHRQIKSNLFLGVLIFAIVIVSFDSFLGYTGYMLQCLFLVDFSEFLAFLIAPAYYLFVYAKLFDRAPKKWIYHFLPSAIYFLYTSIFFQSVSLEYKYNAYISAYHPDVEHIPSVPQMYDPLLLKSLINELLLVSMLLYTLLSIWRFLQARQMKEKRAFVRSQIILFVLSTILFAGLKEIYQNDMGDYIMSAFLTIIIYSLTIDVIQSSSFFNTKQDKYQKSPLTPALKEALLAKINQLFIANEMYLSPSISLRKLAQTVDSTENYVSQVINECLGKSFAELVAFHRIEKAKELLRSESHRHLSIESIAESVGYNSKSAFNKSFKKLTDKTPSEFRSS